MIKKYVIGMAVATLALLTFQCRQAPEAQPQVTSFYETEVFRAIQMARFFEDSKTVVDLLRDRSPSDMEALYLAEKDKPDFDLRAFVAAHFTEPLSQQKNFHTDTTRTMYEHISGMWGVLRRGPDPSDSLSSRIPLPHPYVVPGGRFREIYYWDSYFTMIGLVADDQAELAHDMLANFAYLIDTLGFIPNGTRDYYLTRSQPPFFSLMVDLLAQEDSTVADRYFPQVEKEYAYWMAGSEGLPAGGSTKRIFAMGGDTVLNRYWDSGTTPRPESYAEDFHLASGLPSDSAKAVLYANLRAAAASGWDFSSRWYATEGEFASTQTTELAPVDLNALMYFMETFLAEGYRARGHVEQAEAMAKKAAIRAIFIRERMWDAQGGFFRDFDVVDGVQTPEITLAGVFPLYFGLATPDQAEAVKDRLLEDFLQPGGLRTTLKASGQQWDAPNGWAPLQWMAVKGLERYGYAGEARDIASRWLHLNEKVYRDTGKMMEKYNVADTTLLSGGGEYPTQDGFGWSNGVALGFRDLLAED
ncbi:alpha,alpha-trehalase TreF [Robiginitalea sp. M366]|uniref:alpha,alpha-trehalase TreF n=1 Tax=Robiginitalea aestuariiviva TaxID=3036903 RepID=UPI00240CF364|nr:alpha,alpha-trehalase TreF [Robiginitalea aestuariiviva]MDG1571232.1 alpha,alpha-trehalase TreF [Robiginitalea aestuariiviva]